MRLRTINPRPKKKKKTPGELVPAGFRTAFVCQRFDRSWIAAAAACSAPYRPQPIGRASGWLRTGRRPTRLRSRDSWARPPCARMGANDPLGPPERGREVRAPPVRTNSEPRKAARSPESLRLSHTVQ